MFVADKVGRQGYQTLPINTPEGYAVKEVYRDKSTGLDAYLAYNPTTHSAFVGVAGVNGIAKDRPGSKPDTMQVVVGGSGQAGAFFQQGILEDLRSLSVQGPGAGEFKVTIAPHRGGGGPGDALLMGMVAGLNSEKSVIAGWNLADRLRVQGRKDVTDPFAPIDGLRLSKITYARLNAMGSEYLLDSLGMGLKIPAYAQAFEAINRDANALNIITQFKNPDGTPGLMDFVPQLLGRSLGKTCVARVDPTEVDGSLAEYLHSPEGAFAQFLMQNGNNLNACVPIEHKPLPMESTFAILQLFKDFKWEDNASALPAGVAEIVLAATLSYPGETTQSVRGFLDYMRGEVGEGMTTAIGAFLEAGLKYTALTNPVGFVQGFLALFGGSKLSNGVIGSPTREAEFLAGEPKLAQGAN